MDKKRMVVMNEQAVLKAEKYIKILSRKKGIKLSRGAAFAVAIDNLLAEEFNNG